MRTAGPRTHPERKAVSVLSGSRPSSTATNFEVGSEEIGGSQGGARTVGPRCTLTEATGPDSTCSGTETCPSLSRNRRTPLQTEPETTEKQIVSSTWVGGTYVEYFKSSTMSVHPNVWPRTVFRNHLKRMDLIYTKLVILPKTENEKHV